MYVITQVKALIVTVT